MCGRYVVVTETAVVAKKFNVHVPPEVHIQPNFNVAAGDTAPVITCEDPTVLQNFTFGYTPSWSKKKTYVINARSEGDHNKENRPDYRGAKGIISKPFYRQSIRSKRCLVIADAFIEGTTKEKLSKPFLVHMLNKRRPFAFAGLYDEWIDPSSGEILNTFAIITCPPNQLMRKIPHHRMPVILDEKDYGIYLDQSAPLQEITELLVPYDHKLMNAYPISDDVKNPCNKGADLVAPLGNLLQEEFKIEHQQKSILQGMGMSPSRRRKLTDEDKIEGYDSIEQEVDQASDEMKKSRSKKNDNPNQQGHQ